MPHGQRLATGVGRISALKGAAKRRFGPVVAARRPQRVDLDPALWNLEVGPNGTLWRDGVDLDALARSHGTPLHVVDGLALDRNAHDATAPARKGLDVDVFFSYKTNPVPSVIARLHRGGIGAEVISEYELWLATKLDVPPERIIYNGPAKSPDSIRSAIQLGVSMINANSASELYAIADAAAGVGRPANVGVRASLGHPWGSQFGLGSDAAAFRQSVERGQSDEFVNLRALHVHRGNTIRDRDVMTTHVGAVLALCDELYAAFGWHPDVLDVGGSLACPTVAPIKRRELRLNVAIGADILPPDPDDCLSVGDAARLAVELVDAHYRRRRLRSPSLVLEPGRGLVGNTQMLLTSVVDVKRDEDVHYAVLDAGINVAEPVTSEYHQLLSVSAPTERAEQSYRLVGPICTSADTLYHSWRLPPLRPGDVLAIMDSGAYFVPFTTAFSFPRPAIVVQSGTTIETARRAESFDDLVALDDFRVSR
jgi:diaminopimelate decarboxylase